MLLDDYAGFQGRAFPSQQTLAGFCGGSVRSVQRWLGELTEYVTVYRTRRQAAVYLLSWVPTERKGLRNQEATPVSCLEFKTRQNEYQEATPVSPPSYNTEPSIEPSRVFCPECGDYGRIGLQAGVMGGEICECPAGADIRVRINQPTTIGDFFRRRA